MPQQMLPRGRVYRYPPGRGISDVPTPGVAGGMFSVPYDVGGMPLRDASLSQQIPIEALASALANASPEQQRTMLGENLYPLVEQLEPDNAAKVTGMLLEMDQTEVLHLLESPEALKAKVAEAMNEPISILNLQNSTSCSHSFHHAFPQQQHPPSHHASSPCLQQRAPPLNVPGQTLLLSYTSISTKPPKRHREPLWPCLSLAPSLMNFHAPPSQVPCTSMRFPAPQRSRKRRCLCCHGNNHLAPCLHKENSLFTSTNRGRRCLYQRHLPYLHSAFKNSRVSWLVGVLSAPPVFEACTPLYHNYQGALQLKLGFN